MPPMKYLPEGLSNLDKTYKMQVSHQVVLVGIQVVLLMSPHVALGITIITIGLMGTAVVIGHTVLGHTQVTLG